MPSHPRRSSQRPAERARHMKRVPRPQPITVDAGAFTLTGPITFTTTIVRDASSSTTAPQTTTVFTVTSVSSTSTPVLETSTSSSQAPESSLPLSSLSVVPQPSASVLSTPSGTTSGGVAEGAQSGAASSGLPSGAIAGITITAILVVVGLILFIFRNRLMRRRRRRSAALWFNKPTITPFDTNTTEKLPYSNVFPSSTGGYGPSSPGSQFAQAQARALAGTPVIPPGASYNKTLFSIPTQDAAVVKSTFIPSLPDELSITSGETVRIVQEFDDGWALCLNAGGKKGMVPMECLDRPRAGAIGKRESSLYGISTIRR